MKKFFKSIYNFFFPQKKEDDCGEVDMYIYAKEKAIYEHKYKQKYMQKNKNRDI